MHLLILGGTVFLGRHLVEAALAAGHEVTLFNRGKTAPGLYPEVEELHGDREGDLSLLSGRHFDSVIDTSGYLPRIVALSAEHLRELTPHYCFISSISVYADLGISGIDESGAVAELPEPSEDIGEHYGALKALCENEVAERYAGGALIIRPGLIVGPHDPSNRYTYWVTRAASAGRMLAPAPADAPVQFIDARDLAIWTISLCERKVVGTFNATSEPITFAELIDSSVAAAGTSPEVIWVDTGFLVEHDIEEWTELPMWASSDGLQGAMRIDVSKALAEGLTTRPPTETATATLDWARSLKTPPGEAGLSAEKEEALLSAWEGARPSGGA